MVGDTLAGINNDGDSFSWSENNLLEMYCPGKCIVRGNVLSGVYAGLLGSPYPRTD